jgi:hypothetical protein
MQVSFRVLLASDAKDLCVLYSDDNCVRLVQSSEAIQIIKTVRLDQLTRSLMPWSRMTAMTCIEGSLAIACDDKCIRVMEIDEIISKETAPAVKIGVKRTF